MTKLLSITALILIVITLSGCASIFTRTKYPVAFNSTPSEANLSITDKKGKIVFSGTTPTVVKLSSSAGFFSKAEYEVKISFPGYQTHVTTITASLEGIYFGNILLGGLIGMLIVDPATGAMWRIDTEELNIDLKSERDNTMTLQVIDIKDVPENQRAQLVRVN